MPSPSVLVVGRAGAEGATAPEPLRPKDRRGTTLWKAEGRATKLVRLTEGVSRALPNGVVNLSGSKDRGGAAEALSWSLIFWRILSEEP